MVSACGASCCAHTAPLKQAPALLFTAALALCPLFAHAQASDAEWRGHLKYQPALVDYPAQSVHAQLGPNAFLAHEVEGRLINEGNAGDWSYTAHGELLGLGGAGVAAAERTAAALPGDFDRELLITDDRRLVDATAEMNADDDGRAVLRVDRLSAGWTSRALSVRFGRDAVSWGSGLVFSVFDLFNPFSPTEVDKDYKTGDDMAHAQLSLPGGGELQVLAVGRRDPESRTIASSEASYAVKFADRAAGPKIDFDMLAARHYGETLGGIGLSRSIAGAVLRLEGVICETVENRNKQSFTANIDRSFSPFGYNLYLFIEYYRNGFGRTDVQTALNAGDLLRRVGRGEVFVLGRDYLAAGLQLELHPLVSWFHSTIQNLHDESGYLQEKVVYDLTQSTQLMAGVNVPYGPESSEFGGIAIAGEQALLASPASLYLRAALFF